MTTRLYPVDFYEATKPGINISPNTFSGPGGITFTTDLRLYGQGTQDWGESVNENFVKLAENFAGASAPLNPIEGQFWYSIKQYHFDSSGSVWYIWNGTSWSTIDVTHAASAPSSPRLNDYWYDTIAERLYMWDRRYDQVEPAWVERVFAKSTTAPAGQPSKTLTVWDGTKWNPLTAITASDTQPPGSTNGQMWFDTVNKRLWIYDQGIAQWTEIILTYGNSKMVDTLTLDNKRLLTVAAPVDDNDVVNKLFIDDAVSVAASDLTADLSAHILDDIRHLTLSQNALMDGILISATELLALKGLNVNVADAIANLSNDFAGLLDGKLDRAGGVMTGPLKVDDFTDPLDVVPKQYMDDNKRLNTMLDVVVPPGGIPNGAILRFDGTSGKWVPELPATANGLSVESSSYYTMPGETITLSARIQLSDGTVQTVTPANVNFKVNSVVISGNTYVIPTGAGATFTIDADLKPGVTITIDGIPYTEATLPSTPKTVYVATGLEISGPTTVNHNSAYTYTVKKVFSDGTKPSITGTFAWTLASVNLGNSTGTITIPSTVSVGSGKTLTATINSRSGSLSLTVNAINTSLTIEGPATAFESATVPGYTIKLNKSDGSYTVVNTLASVSLPGGSWIGGSNVTGGASIIAPSAPSLTYANQWLYTTIYASYAGFNATKPLAVTYLPPPVYTNADMFVVISNVDMEVRVNCRLTDGAMWQDAYQQPADRPGANGQQFYPPGYAPPGWGQSANLFTVSATNLSRYATVTITPVDTYNQSGELSTIVQQPNAANGWVTIVAQYDYGPSSSQGVATYLKLTTTV